LLNDIKINDDPSLFAGDLVEETAAKRAVGL